MKTLKTLLRILATYLASRCYKKLISSEEVSEERVIKTFENPDTEVMFIVNFHPPYTMKDESGRILSKSEREDELQKLLKRWRIQKLSAEYYKISCTIKRYALNKELTLNVLEYNEHLALISDKTGLILYKHFQWID